MAIINDIYIKNLRSSFSVKDDKVIFRATISTLEQARNSRGYVHVLDSKTFKKRNPIEYISYESVKPIQVVEVFFDDLPKEIEVVTSSEGSKNPQYS